MNDIMSVREVVKRAKADNLPISEYALRRWVSQQKIPCAWVGKKAILYYPNVVNYLKTAGKEGVL